MEVAAPVALGWNPPESMSHLPQHMESFTTSHPNVDNLGHPMDAKYCRLYNPGAVQYDNNGNIRATSLDQQQPSVRSTTPWVLVTLPSGKRHVVTLAADTIMSTILPAVGMPDVCRLEHRGEPIDLHRRACDFPHINAGCELSVLPRVLGGMQESPTQDDHPTEEEMYASILSKTKTMLERVEQMSTKPWEHKMPLDEFRGRCLKGVAEIDEAVKQLGIEGIGKYISKQVETNRSVEVEWADTHKTKTVDVPCLELPDEVFSVAFSPTDAIMAVGSKGGLHVWNFKSGEKRKFQGHTKKVLSVAFSPDGTTLASGSADESVRIWDVDSGDVLTVGKAHSDVVRCVAFSPDGRLLASGSDDHTASLWKVSCGIELRVLARHTDYIQGVAFAPDSVTLASVSDDYTIRLWNVTCDDEPRVLTSINEYVMCVAFGPEGELLATGTKDGTVRLWDLTSGAEPRVLVGHGECVTSVAFSPKGTTLATGSNDHTVRLWKVVSGAQLCKFTGHTEPVKDVAFSSDGIKIASCGRDKAICFWAVPVGCK